MVEPSARTKASMAKFAERQRLAKERAAAKAQAQGRLPAVSRRASMASAASASSSASAGTAPPKFERIHAAAMARSRSIADVHAARKTPGKARARPAAVAQKKTPLVAATASAGGLARAAAALAAGDTPQPMFAPAAKKSTKKLAQPHAFSLSGAGSTAVPPQKAAQKVRTAAGTTRYTGRLPDFEDTTAESAILIPKENVPAPKKFDLKASLSKPLAYKPHKGSLRQKQAVKKIAKGAKAQPMQEKVAQHMANVSDRRGSVVQQRRRSGRGHSLHGL